MSKFLNFSIIWFLELPSIEIAQAYVLHVNAGKLWGTSDSLIVCSLFLRDWTFHCSSCYFFVLSTCMIFIMIFPVQCDWIILCISALTGFTSYWGWLFSLFRNWWWSADRSKTCPVGVWHLMPRHKFNW